MDNENKPEQLPLFPEPEIPVIQFPTGSGKSKHIASKLLYDFQKQLEVNSDEVPPEVDDFEKELQERIRLAKDKNTTVIETTSNNWVGKTIHLEGKKRIYIAPADVDIFEKLQNLPDEVKILIFQISIESMEKYILKKRKSALEYIKELLAYQWYYKETGDQVDLKDVDFPEYNMRLSQLRDHLATSRVKKPNLEQIRAAILFLNGSNSEFYRLDEAGEWIYGEGIPDNIDL